jgi:NADH:ubiquinone oxidoreductase subunit 4 (subunit M)
MKNYTTISIKFTLTASFLQIEIILIPMLFIIGYDGSRSRKVKAIFYFFLYTFMGSLLLLLGLICIYFETGTTNLIVLNLYSLAEEKQKILFFLFFIPFAIKIPIVPFHLWLLEAHTEAPTYGSMILAGLLLKLGSFGFCRIIFTLFFEALIYYKPFLFLITLLSLIYSSLLLLSLLKMLTFVLPFVVIDVCGENVGLGLFKGIGGFKFS